MRWLFILFLSLNAIYFGWELDRQFKIDRKINSPDARLLSGARKLELISESVVTPQLLLPSVDVTAVTSDFSELEILLVTPDNHPLVTELPDIAIVNIEEEAVKKYCYTFGPIEEEILAIGIGDWFKSRRAKTNVHFTDERGNQLFWIYLTPQDTGREAVDIIRDLQDKGIGDYRLINKGDLLNAISLGLYSGRAAMNDRIALLKEQGYKPVVVPYADGKRLYWVDVQLNVDPGALAAIFKGYPSRYNYVPVDCNKFALLATSP